MFKQSIDRTSSLIVAKVIIIITQYLIPYFKNLDSKNIEFELFKGELNLQNVELSEEFFKLQNLPFIVKESIIGNMKL